MYLSSSRSVSYGSVYISGVGAGADRCDDIS